MPSRRRKAWGVGAAMGDGPGGPGEFRKRESSGKIRSHFSMIQTHWPSSTFSIIRDITPYPYPREAKWTQPSALAEMQKVLPWEGK